MAALRGRVSGSGGSAFCSGGRGHLQAPPVALKFVSEETQEGLVAAAAVARHQSLFVERPFVLGLPEPPSAQPLEVNTNKCAPDTDTTNANNSSSNSNSHTSSKDRAANSYPPSSLLKALLHDGALIKTSTNTTSNHNANFIRF